MFFLNVKSSNAWKKRKTKILLNFTKFYQEITGTTPPAVWMMQPLSLYYIEQKCIRRQETEQTWIYMSSAEPVVPMLSRVSCVLCTTRTIDRSSAHLSTRLFGHRTQISTSARRRLFFRWKTRGRPMKISEYVVHIRQIQKHHQVQVK